MIINITNKKHSPACVFNESMIASSERLQNIDFITCFEIFSDSYVNFMFHSFRNTLLQFSLISKLFQSLECDSSGSMRLHLLLRALRFLWISDFNSFLPLLNWEENGNKEIISFLPFIYINSISASKWKHLLNGVLIIFCIRYDYLVNWHCFLNPVLSAFMFV